MMPIEVGTVLYAGAIGLVVIGIAGIVLSHHLFRIILALVIAEAGANLLLVLSGFRWEAIAPIITGGGAVQAMVDPVPQAMALTSIVIGVGVQALALSLTLRAKTLDIRELQRRMSADLAGEAGTPLPQSLEEPVGDGR
ncbi:MAG: Na+/H+ antiporter subunit C [endosymbiont of Seepiophila jonesi]|uniref:Na+/H+ antiporter subunit C n=1 Tax=endosymbiont of Lamellibrachia luymesi TaxID=2200907 RepID=A0A370DXS8_9GAMM|nr:MAG: Na+/H+ antiporter subunit C [endosymbiont of Lamellibrachia luymesi]RDH94249.1 MAG: Na+/H+ antiporter subunit C [endosymbiont of Seepiophila jonesi]